MRFKLLAASMLALSFSLFSAIEAFAINAGPLQIHPYVDFKTVYDDNIYSTNGDREDDTFFIISPGLLLQLGERDNKLELEYRADIFRYIDTGEFNDIEDHNIRALAYLKFNRFTIDMKELGSRAHEPRSEANQAVSGVELNKYWSNDFKAEIGLDITSKLKVAVGYSNFYIDFDPSELGFRNRVDNSGSLTVSFKAFPKTSFLVQGIYRDINHFEDSLEADRLDSVEYWALGGVSWDITSSTRGSIKGGYEWKDFDIGEQDFGHAVYLVSVDHFFTTKTSISINGAMQANETDDPEAQYYTTTGGSLVLHFKPVTKLSLDPYGSYTHNKYSGDVTVDGDTARRSDDVWTAGIDIKYDFNKWLSAGIGYRHSKRVSNLTFYDYTDNMAMVTIKAVL